MFCGKWLHIIILCNNIWVLPKFCVKTIFKFFCISKRCISYFQRICKCEYTVCFVCCHRNRSLICTCFRILWHLYRYPYILKCIFWYRNRFFCVLIKHFIGFFSAALRNWSCRTSISRHSSICLYGFNKCKRYIILGNASVLTIKITYFCYHIVKFFFYSCQRNL